MKENIVIPMIAIPSLEHSPGSIKGKIGERLYEGEIHLFDMTFTYDQARDYRKSCGSYLRRYQWNDIVAEV